MTAGRDDILEPGHLGEDPVTRAPVTQVRPAGFGLAGHADIRAWGGTREGEDTVSGYVAKLPLSFRLYYSKTHGFSYIPY